MPIISEKYHKEKIKQLDRLINKAFWLKHKNIWHLIKWRKKHESKLNNTPEGLGQHQRHLKHKDLKTLRS